MEFIESWLVGARIQCSCFFPLPPPFAGGWQRKKTGALNIAKYNPLPLGQREVIFPIGTKFHITGFTDNQQIRVDNFDVGGQTEEVAIPRHIIKLTEVEPYTNVFF